MSLFKPDPELPAAPNARSSPAAGMAAGLQLPAKFQLAVLLPTQVSLAADNGRTTNRQIARTHSPVSVELLAMIVRMFFFIVGLEQDWQLKFVKGTKSETVQ